MRINNTPTANQTEGLIRPFEIKISAHQIQGIFPMNQINFGSGTC